MLTDAPIKILVIGNSAVGKTSLLNRYIDNTSDLDSEIENQESTLGMSCESKIVKLEGESHTLQIWDSAGQERFKTITSSFYQGADAILLVFDLTNTMSFNDIRQWDREVERFKSGKVSKIIAGNKNDLVEERKVEKNVAQSLASSLKLDYYETSAKTLENVEIIFESLATQVLKNRKNGDMSEVEAKKFVSTRVMEPPPVKRQRTCCML